jgi:hypothetical protein
LPTLRQSRLTQHPLTDFRSFALDRRDRAPSPKKHSTNALNLVACITINRLLYHAAWPPSILRSAPVMNELASLNKNTAAPRYSSGFDKRPNMFCVGHVSLRSGYFLKSSSTIAVTMYPGEMVLTRMLCSPHSDARLRASCITPAFDALYAEQMRPY